MSNFNTIDAIEHSAVEGIIAGADEVLAIKQLAERQTQALNAIRELCANLDAQGRGHGAAPTQRDVIRAGVADDVLALIDEAGA